MLEISAYSIPPGLGALFSLGLGLFVLLQNYRVEIHRVLSAMCFSLVLWLGPYAIAYSTNNTGVAIVCTRIACTSVALFHLYLYHLVIAFLDLKRERKILYACYALTPLLLYSFLFTDLFLTGTHHYFWGFYSKAGPLHPPYIAVGIMLWIRCLYLLYKHADAQTSEIRRAQIRYAFWVFLLVMPCMVDYIPKYGFEFYPIGFVFVLLFTFVMAFAIIKHQLFDIRIVIRKSLIYSLLVAAITTTYLVAVLVIERFFQGFFGYQSVIATVLVAFLISIFFNPVRNKIQTFVDRSLFKATTAELAEQREKLLIEVRKSEQQKAVATLAAGMAHEIKNPLTAIKTFTEHLPEKFDSEEFRAKFHKIVGGEVERINHIVQQLLDFSKPVPPKLQPVQINNILDETLEFLNSDLIERHIEVTKDYDAFTTIQGDPQQLKQVFLNLFLNSLQAMNGSGKLNISTTQADSNLTITIQDNGEGMTQQTLDRLFEPFYTTKSTGTGLGLSVVKGIIDEHGGSVQVESNDQKGTKVKVNLSLIDNRLREAKVNMSQELTA